MCSCSIQQNRAACRSYKYVGPNFSFLERLCLERMWAWLPGNVYPRWLAPNVISLAGGCCILAASALMWAYSPDMRGEAPPWVYAVQALLIFCYQTLDGSDGKQARATGSGSALGEMVDHGIDALTTAACACLCSDAAALGIYAGWTWLQIGALQVRDNAVSTAAWNISRAVNSLVVADLGQWRPEYLQAYKAASARGTEEILWEGLYLY